MRWFPFCLCLASVLGAQDTLHVVSVERRGPPPYEAIDRIYGLDGGRAQGLKVGDRLLVKRAGEVRAIGHLRVIGLRGERAETRFEPAGTEFPMKGDLALLDVLAWPPGLGKLNEAPLTLISPPRAKVEAPPLEGLIFFLPQQAEVSPAGVRKMEAWVATWGVAGRWAVQVPTTKALSPALQKQRAESLRAALRALGIDQITIDLDPRALDSKYDPTWIRHWD